ncbi:MAG: biotin/lipoyl-binding protein [Candidatus Azobacteroides pseudotrichonymphae]|jgi:biotin carboxyl carrier protein|uniref:Methylmalonyl-CoA decarboxylase gamma subunit n=1 Tax=Azobacteroides pseudotrichonymphae genomovar. CFP2 TaxID=511995 RepID=B6YRH3_AZOPC|nr:biotin/lipoyl-containing protein [Candidatus Azobacteroides pseudotrichonymphae]MDR0530202.1 biotin/lipoyl-binding protein [Bacteroidales bacterium OttesenSCG-928-I14]BAG83795.1 putative methylmalonyl-CoA decarboxylase gamma subunit [Candidatus Azobacteroides pseudotrichonymphae genomovar. CFP2]GMO35379.1 MAG: biotin/lipoyl-binding protein [Candidatus Azobacteroides pseudotrichonymphae]
MKSFKYTINGNVYKVVINRIEDTTADVEVNGTPYKVEMNKPAKKHVITINRPVQTVAPPVTRPQPLANVSALHSPLPGIVLDLFCKRGDIVKKGQKLLILEAMKMENVINSDRDGVIKEIKVSKGDSVLEGASLVIIG